MGNLFSFPENIFINQLEPLYTIKLSQTRWAAIYSGYETNPSAECLSIIENNNCYTIKLLSTMEPIDEAIYFEIYKDFKTKPVWNWCSVPKTISNKILMGIWGLYDAHIDNIEVSF